MKWFFVSCSLLLGCVTPVELGPKQRDVFIVGSPSARAIERLASGEAALVPAARLAITQPSAAVAVPRNIAPLRFAWRTGPAPKLKPDDPKPPGAGEPPEPGLSTPPMAAMPEPPTAMSEPPMAAAMPAPDAPVAAYALVLRGGDRTLLQLYTDAAQASFPEEPWREVLAASEGRVLELELRALLGDDQLLRAAPLTIEVRGAVPSGAVYAFSTTAQGIVRASIEQARSSYLPLGSAEGARCVGCHAVSRDGRKLFAAAGGGQTWLGGELGGGELQANALPVEAQAAEAVFGSFDPSGTRVAITSGGVLSIVAADTGATIDSASWPGMRVSMPDWSPDGSAIAVSLDVVDDAQVKKPGPRGSDIARVRVASDGSLGAPERLIEPPPGNDVARVFPSYSPDGSFIAFEQRMGPMAQMGSLFVVASGGGPAIALDHATPRAGPDGSGAWPSWMNGDRPDRPWLVFASTRAPDGTELSPGQRQLFASAIDLGLVALGQDPSLAAFWLPFQERTSSYRHAVWAPVADACVPQPEQCNAVDDDCDDAIDEACCDALPETCGDGIDDDCDAISDEGCDCSERDVCGDAMDNDCDGQVDELTCGPARAEP